MTVRAQKKDPKDCPIILLHLPMQTAVHLLSALKMILQSQELTTTTTMSMIYLEYPLITAPRQCVLLPRRLNVLTKQYPNHLLVMTIPQSSELHANQQDEVYYRMGDKSKN